MKILIIAKRLRHLICLLIIVSNNLIAADMSAKSILDSMIMVIHPISSQGKMEQEIITSSNIKRVFTFNYFSERGTNVLIRYIEPRKVKNNAFLIKNNAEDIWVYFPRTRRVRKLTSHSKKQKAQGSDFSYEDFSGSKEWKADYSIQHITSDERANYLLSLTRKVDAVISYDSLKIYVNKLNYYPDRIFYYQDDIHLKTLHFQDIQHIQGIPTAMSMRMENHAENSHTTITILDIKYNVIFNEGFFTEQNLEK